MGNPRSDSDFRLFLYVKKEKGGVLSEDLFEEMRLYVKETGKSPFRGDDNFVEMQKFFNEHGHRIS